MTCLLHSLAIFFTILGILIPSTCSFSDDEFHGLQRKLTNMEIELTETKSKLNTVMKETSKFERLSRAMDAMCRKWQSGEEDVGKDATMEGDARSSEGVTTSASGSGSEQSNIKPVPIQVLHVEIREDQTFLIKYSTSSEVEVETRHVANLTQSMLNEVSIIEGSASSTYVEPYIYIVTKDKGFATKLGLDMATPSSVDIPPIHMDLNVQGDVVFEPGESTSVIVRMKDVDADFIRSYGMFTENRNDTGMAMYTHDEYPSIVNSSHAEGNSTNNEYTFTINAGGEDYEGILSIQIVVDTGTGGPVAYLHSRFRRDVRRSDHDVMFQDGFIGFLFYHHDRVIRKYEGSVWKFSFILFGHETKNITVWRQTPMGELEINDNANRTYGRTSVTAEFRIDNLSGSDSGRYELRGSSRLGKVIRKEFDVEIMSNS